MSKKKLTDLERKDRLVAKRDRLAASVKARLDATDKLTADEHATLAADIDKVQKLTAEIATAFPVASPGIPASLARSNKTPDPTVLKAGDWIDVNTGKRASLRAGEKLAEHPVLKAAAGDSERQHGSLAKLLAALSTSGASAVVPDAWSTQIIDQAVAASAIGQAGSTLIPMPTKVFEVGRITGQPTAAFRDEGSAITASDPSFDNVTLTAKSMNALVIASVEWLADATNASDLIAQTIAEAMSSQLDLVALYGGITSGHGDGIDLGDPNPVGILSNLTTNRPDNVLGGEDNGTSQTATSFWGEILDTVFTVVDGNETPNAVVWNSKLARLYAKATNANGDYLAAPEALPTRYVSNRIPSYTQGTLTTATDVFAGDFRQLLVGVRSGLSIRTLAERYADNGQVGFLASWRGDIQVARPTAFAVYTALKGA